MSFSSWHIYLPIWASLCAIAIGLMFIERRRLTLFTGEYWSFLCQPWKLTFFTVAVVGMMVMAPYTCDPTWDWVDAGVMGLLTFTTAPWALGVLVRFPRWRGSRRHLFIAAIIWMFSASWFYDGYILLRDGIYPSTWSANIVASSILYGLGGLLWSLDLTADDRIGLCFLHDDWLRDSRPIPFVRVLPYAIGISVPVALGLGYLLIA